MQPKGPFCQSCAMPMESPDLFGTEADGSKSKDYCTYCFQNGRFTEPEIAMQAMIDKCVAVMVQMNIMPEEQARTLMTKTLPTLKRWRA
ncbi:MAG: zinc ribbon domain-containing protein [Candidatus Eisenbacteria bacterium]|nr:zinc ribbon domain-containing protein [Candidatus Eisenbacteria bacterium]